MARRAKKDFADKVRPFIRKAEIESALNQMDMNELEYFFFIWVNKDGKFQTASNEMSYDMIYAFLQHAAETFHEMEVEGERRGFVATR